MCRASYIDPRVIDAYQGGIIIEPAMQEAEEDMEPGGPPVIHHPAVERAVLSLVTGHEAAPGLEQIPA